MGSLMRIGYRKFNLSSSFSMPKKHNKISQKSVETFVSQSPVIVKKNGDISIKIHAKPGCKHNGITDMNSEAVSVQIAAPPVDGEANTELIKYISTILGVRKSNITLDKGSKSKEKILLVSDVSLDVDEIVTKLKQAIST